jgi:FlaA1/EpsC-like NDP-sugar epimerase
MDNPFNPGLNLRPVGFIDDDLQKKGKRVNGYPILGTLDTLKGLLEKNPVSEIIVAGDNVPKENLDHLPQICLSYHILLRRFQTRLEEIPTP